MWTASVEPPKFREDYIEAILASMVAMNVIYLREHPSTPLLYQSGVRYRREPPGRERWATIPHALRLGYGDCEDLATWLCAQYQVLGELGARAIARGKDTPRGRLVHILVQRADGRIEDPSRELGM